MIPLGIDCINSKYQTAMTRINVISINPAQITLGALHPEKIIRKRRDKKRAAASLSETEDNPGARRTRRSFGMKSRLNFFFGINAETGMKTSLKLFVCRILFSAFLITWCLLSLATAPVEVVSAFLVVGLLLMIGLFTRVATFCGFVASATYAVIELAVESTLNESMVLLALGCLIFCMLGPGRVSLDSIIRTRLFRLAKLVSLRKARQLVERRLSYKAYSC